MTSLPRGHALLLRPPAEVAPIVAVIGADATLRLIEQLGGMQGEAAQSRPARPASSRGTIGADALRCSLLVDAYRRRQHVSTCRCASRGACKVLRLRDGMSYSPRSRESLAWSKRTVYRYLNAAGMTDQPRIAFRGSVSPSLPVMPTGANARPGVFLTVATMDVATYPAHLPRRHRRRARQRGRAQPGRDRSGQLDGRRGQSRHAERHEMGPVGRRVSRRWTFPNLTRDQAVAIYFALYWQKAACGGLPAQISHCW